MRRKILIVDDEGDHLYAMETMLRDDFAVVLAGPDNAVEDAISLWDRDSQLRLAIVDLKMPGLNRESSSEQCGVKLIGLLKGIRRDARIAVRSAVQSHENLAKAIESGADAFIGKDWNAAEFLKNVHLLHAWISLCPLLRALCETLKFRDPNLAVQPLRVRELCKVITIHLSDAEPANFNLAACLLAAELRHLDNLRLSDSPIDERNVSDLRVQVSKRRSDSKSLFEELGPDFADVADIIRDDCLLCGASSLTPAEDEAELKRSLSIEEFRLEARVLHMAEFLDGCLTDQLGPLGNAPAFVGELIQRAKERNDLDPKMMSVLRTLIATDDGFRSILSLGQANRNGTLPLY